MIAPTIAITLIYIQLCLQKVLNAKPENVEREAEIVAQSGRLGAVTIATNMAGRGTDIILGGNSEFMARLKLREILMPRYMTTSSYYFYLLILIVHIIWNLKFTHCHRVVKGVFVPLKKAPPSPKKSWKVCY